MTYEQVRRIEARDQASRDALAETAPKVGDSFDRFLNQADRDCEVIAVVGRRYAFVYEMPSGVEYIRVGDRTTRTERSVSRARLPKWLHGALIRGRDYVHLIEVAS